MIKRITKLTGLLLACTSVTASIPAMAGEIKKIDSLNKSGIMQTGWINDNGIWYYCDSSGSMLADTTIDGYILGSDGAWIK